MQLQQLSYRSLVQRPAKSLFLLAAIVLALVTVLILATITSFLGASINNSMQEHGVIVNVELKDGRTQFDYFGIIITTSQTASTDLILSQLTVLEQQLLASNLHLQVSSQQELSTHLNALESAHPSLLFQADLGVFQARQQLFEQFANYSHFTIALIIIISFFLVSTITMASVNERYQEFAVLRTVGFRMRSIFNLVLLEIFLLYLSAIVVTLIISVIWSQYILSILFLDDYYFYLPINVYLSVIFSGFFITILAALLPASRAAKMNPIESLSMFVF